VYCELPEVDDSFEKNGKLNGEIFWM